MTCIYSIWQVLSVARITSGHCTFNRVWLVQDFPQYVQITTKYGDRDLPRITKCLLCMLDALFTYIFRSKKPGCRTFWHDKAIGFRYKSTFVVISMYSFWASCNYVTRPAHFGYGFIQFITRYSFNPGPNSSVSLFWKSLKMFNPVVKKYFVAQSSSIKEFFSTDSSQVVPTLFLTQVRC
jgi:hypothetical protein